MGILACPTIFRALFSPKTTAQKAGMALLDPGLAGELKAGSGTECAPVLSVSWVYRKVTGLKEMRANALYGSLVGTVPGTECMSHQYGSRNRLVLGDKTERTQRCPKLPSRGMIGREEEREALFSESERALCFLYSCLSLQMHSPVIPLDSRKSTTR